MDPLLKIVFQNENIIAVDKPAGWLTRPSRAGEKEKRKIVSVELEETFGKIWIAHRLDCEVSGLLLFARTRLAHRMLNYVFESKQLKKNYQALTHIQELGALPAVGTPQTWESKICDGKRRSFFADYGKPAKTVARFVSFYRHDEYGKLPFWELEPVTGRRHQLRLELASRGFPVVGDLLYGAPSPQWIDGIALRATRIRIMEASVREKLGFPEVLEVEGLVKAA